LESPRYNARTRVLWRNPGTGSGSPSATRVPDVSQLAVWHDGSRLDFRKWSRSRIRT